MRPPSAPRYLEGIAEYDDAALGRSQLLARRSRIVRSTGSTRPFARSAVVGVPHNELGNVAAALRRRES
jgi:hypothetical protein